MIKQAQEMGDKLKDITEQLKHQRVTASSGGGMVTVEANGLGEILSVRIEQQLFDDNDREMVEDLVPAAVNQAVAKAKQLHTESVKSLTDGMNLPGLDTALSQFTQGGNP